MNSAKINITCDFAGAGGDAGVKFETVYSGYPEFLILNLKAYFLGNWVFLWLLFLYFIFFSQYFWYTRKSYDLARSSGIGNDLVLLLKYLKNKNKNSSCKTPVSCCCWCWGRMSVGMPSITATIIIKASARDLRAEN